VNLPPHPLPERLRLATRSLHAEAERSGAMASLVQGRLPHAGYQRLLAELHRLYGALEAALDANAARPWLAGVWAGPLRRTAALAHDLGPAAAAPACDAATAYVQRLQQLGGEGDPALLAHVYTRYLGDLHGGQILQALVRRRYPGQTTSFYDFGGAEAVATLRHGLRDALAAVPLAPPEADRVVAEACWSFEQHRRLFEALDGA
jgi:heme oxygenase (biliverdin-producing, ferredoxin)